MDKIIIKLYISDENYDLLIPNSDYFTFLSEDKLEKIESENKGP